MSKGYAYIVVIQDGASDNYTYGVPEEPDSPQTIYTSYQDAKVAIQAAAARFDTFQMVAYGSAFPYDDVTFDQLIENKGMAPYGWGIITTEEETWRICIGLLRLKLA